MKTVVVGAGIAGLSAACRMAAKGHKVTILEKNSDVGGKISVVSKDGFTWDGGPSFFTDPEELKQLFTDCGKEINNYLELKELDEACRYWYNGYNVKAYDSVDKLANELKDKFDEPVDNTKNYFADMSKIYESSGSIFLNKELTFNNVVNLRAIKSLTGLPKYPLTHNMHEVHKRYFDKELSIKFFDRFATYVGANPYSAPGMLSCTPYLEHVIGAFHPVGGMRAIVDVVSNLAKDLGVEVKLGQEITRIEATNKNIKSVKSSNVQYEADNFIFAGDVAQVYEMLDIKKYEKHKKREHSLSAYVLYLGVKKGNEDLYLHNIFFSDDYEKESEYLWQKKQVQPDPTIYINNTSVYEDNVAPQGHENWFVMINVPAGLDELEYEKAREVVVEKIKKLFGKDFEHRIVTEASSLTPLYLEQKYNAFLGSIYGLAANSVKGAYLRPKNKNPKYNNLYHVGVTAHPGGGIPLALKSSKIVSGIIA